jgi:Tfp pilus assembly protein PilN
MTVRAGLLIDETVVTLAIVSGRGPVEYFSFDADDNPGALIATELERRGFRRRRLRAGLDRALAVVKILELPRSESADLSQMVRFELERHVPFPPDDIACDWSSNPGRSGGPLRVLVAACEPRRLDQALRLVSESRRRPLAVSVACHDLRSLLPRTIAPMRVAWAHRHDGRTDLVFLGRGAVRLSRVIPAETPQELVREIQRSLALLGWRDCAALWISGDETDRFISAPVLSELHTAISEPPYSEVGQALVDSLPDERRGAALLALAVAVGARRPRINLLPVGLRPLRASQGQLVTGLMLCLTVLLGIGYLGAQVWQRGRYVRQLSQEIQRLEADTKSVERLSAMVAKKKQLLTTLRTVEAQGLRSLPFLRDLTTLVPQDAWLQALNMDPQGVELIGQAGTASALIPALEASPWLDHVEFTSPVTRGQGKEQFRIHGAWERH